MAEKRPRGRPKQEKSEARVTTSIVMKATPDYAEWLDELHRKTRVPKAWLIRTALAEWCERNGHDLPPEM